MARRPLDLAAHRAACEVLTQAAASDPLSEPVSVCVGDGEYTVTVTVVRAPGQAAVSERAGTGQAVGGEVAEDVRRVLAAAQAPLKIVTIASRAKREPTNHFREVVRRMVAAGELRHLKDPHRYWLAARPLPDVQRG